MDALLGWWQHLPLRIDPNIFTVGAFSLRYYSLMYIVAFCLTYLLVMRRIKTEGLSLAAPFVQDALVWMIIGLILGARLGYVLLYNPAYYLHRPWEIVFPFDVSAGMRFVGISGMSYHGGAVGVIAASLLFCRSRRVSFWRLADLFVPAIPLAYTFGRIGNFLNGELYGRVTTAPWGMFFPLDPLQKLRHPSQLYEAFGEGIVLFSVLWMLRRRSPFQGFLLAWYLIGYGLVRFFIEFYREPDAQLGFVLGPLSMGQILCLLMMAAGGALFLLRRRGETPSRQQDVSAQGGR